MNAFFSRSNLERAGSGASDMRKYASGVAGSDQAKGPVSRKCISRAQERTTHVQFFWVYCLKKFASTISNDSY